MLQRKKPPGAALEAGSARSACGIEALIGGATAERKAPRPGAVFASGRRRGHIERGKLLGLPMKPMDVDETIMMRRAEIVASLRKIVRGEGVIDTEIGRRPYESDGFTAYANLPLAVVLPSNLRSCSRCSPIAMRMASRSCRAALAPRYPAARCRWRDGILIAMTKFNRIQEIDFANRIAVVQPGVTNLGDHPARSSTGASITRRTHPARSPARSAAMSRRIPAACIA